jgi:hypothetical protein
MQPQQPQQPQSKAGDAFRSPQEITGWRERRAVEEGLREAFQGIRDLPRPEDRREVIRGILRGEDEFFAALFP